MQKPVLWYISGKIGITHFQYPYTLVFAFPNHFLKMIIISITTGKFVNWRFGAAANSEVRDLIVLAHFSLTLISFAKAYTGITLRNHAVGSFMLCVQIKFKKYLKNK